MDFAIWRRSPASWEMILMGLGCLASVALPLAGSLAVSAQGETGFGGPGAPTESRSYLPLMTAGSRDGGGKGDLLMAGQVVEPPFVEPAIGVAANVFQAALVRTTDMAALTPPSPDPSGLAYIGARNSLLVSDGEVEETVGGMSHFQGVNTWEVHLDGSVLSTANLSKVAPTAVPMTNEPTGVAWDPAGGDFFFTDDNARSVFTLKPGADGKIGTADDTWTSFDTRPAGSLDPEGIAYDPARKRLFVVDGANSEVYEYTVAGDLAGQFDVERYGVVDPEGVEFNPDRGTLFVLSSGRKQPMIIETTTSGDLLQTVDISAANVIQPAGLAYAPASDGSGAMRFYIVDRGIDNNDDPRVIDGKLYEMTAPGAGNQPPEVEPEETPHWLYLPILSR